MIIFGGQVTRVYAPILGSTRFTEHCHQYEDSLSWTRLYATLVTKW